MPILLLLQLFPLTTFFRHQVSLDSIFLLKMVNIGRFFMFQLESLILECLLGIVVISFVRNLVRLALPNVLINITYVPIQFRLFCGNFPSSSTSGIPV